MTVATLKNLIVVDLSQNRAGPYCTRLFSGFGARVIKVEDPATGDPLRNCGPFFADQPGIERGIPFHWLNCGKESITLNLKTQRGAAILSDLLRRADVLVESFAPGDLALLGLPRDKLTEINRRLIVTSISQFGQDGPYADYAADEAVMYAMSGGMASTGESDRPPLLAGPAIAQYTAGLQAYIATLMAIFRRGADGSGEAIDLSVFESALENVEIHLAEFAYDGKIARRNGDEHLLVPWRCYPCRDGQSAVIGGPVRHWERAAELFEEPRLATPELAHMADRMVHRREVESLFRPWLMRHNKKDIYHQAQAVGLAFGYLATLAEVLDSPQHSARDFFQESEPHPEVGPLRMCGAPFRVGSDSWRIGRAPCLGEQTRQVLSEFLGYQIDEIQHLTEQGIV